jgi:hypothetical protein
MIKVYVLVGVIFGLLAIAKTPWFRGKFGEFIVNIVVRFFLDKPVYHLVKDVTLPTEDGSTQIDHVVVSVYGVFVIETKTMRGAIYGSEYDSRWTQAIGRQKFHFQNPLRQNFKHTKTLAEMLDIPHDKMKPIIMLIGDAKLKTADKLPANVLTHGLLPYIKQHTDVILTQEEVTNVLAVIEEQRLAPGFSTNRQHVQHVRTVVARKEQTKAGRPAPASQPVVLQAPVTVKPISVPQASVAVLQEPVAVQQQSPSCPKCGKTMVMRVAKRGPNKGGSFWGCPGYPKCNGIVQAE